MSSDFKSLASKIYFVTAIGTDIGKTYFTTQICKKLIAEGKKVSAIKPISSGFSMFDEKSDTAKILNSLNQELNKENFLNITKWHFQEPISPHLAVKNSGTEINFAELVNFCQEKINFAQKNDEFLFIEGAGGVMSPINYEKTFLDLIIALKIPLILITANYLGAISHSLTAIECLKNQNITAKILINNFNQHFIASNLPNGFISDPHDMKKLLEKHCNDQIFFLEDFLKTTKKEIA